MRLDLAVEEGGSVGHAAIRLTVTFRRQ